MVTVYHVFGTDILCSKLKTNQIVSFAAWIIWILILAMAIGVISINKRSETYMANKIYFDVYLTCTF